MTRKIRNKYIFITAAILFFAVFFSSCVTEKKAEIVEENQVIEEVIEEKEEEPQLPKVKAVEATEEMWAQIIAQIPPKEEVKEIPSSVDSPVVLEPIVEVEELEPEAVEEKVEKTEKEEVVEEREEESVEEVKEEPQPTFTIIEDENVDEKPQVELLGEDLGVVLNENNREEFTTVEENTSDRIIMQGSESDLNNTKPSWLYSEKERESSATFTPIINIYETKEEEPKDDGIKPEDILVYGEEYKANREDSVPLSKMKKSDLYNAVLSFFASNYPYVCMVFVVLIAVFLVRSLIKHLNIKKNNDASAEKGVEFNSQGNDANDYVFNPMSKAINDIDNASNKDEKKEEKQTVVFEEPTVEVKTESNGFVYIENKDEVELPEATVFTIVTEEEAEKDLSKDADGDEQYYIEDDEDIVFEEEEYKKEDVAFIQAQKVLEEQFGVAI